MICPKCHFEQDEGLPECTRCGIVFSKYRGSEANQQGTKAPYEEKPPVIYDDGNPIVTLFVDVEHDINPLYFCGRVLLFLVILIYGWKFIFCPMAKNCAGTSFWHLVNLPFHEAGHIFFRPFGRFMTSLGGSLGQLLMPLACLAGFLFVKRDTYAASVCLWWFGENFVDLAPYINDARAGVLPLLGGNTGRNSPYGFHDWEFILNEMGWLRYDKLLAGLAHKAGILIMITAFLWGGYLLFRQFKNLDR